MSGRTTRSGMSLLELLLALALLAVIAGGLAGALGLGLRLHDRSLALPKTSDAIALRIRLRSLLAAAVPPSQLAGFPVGLDGRPDGFAFTTFAATGAFPEAAALRVEVRADAGSLRLGIAAMDDAGAALSTDDRLLAEELSGLSFGYFDARSDPPAWRHDWTDESRLPDLVRIEADPGGEPDWPEFTVRPRLDIRAPSS